MYFPSLITNTLEFLSQIPLLSPSSSTPLSASTCPSNSPLSCHNSTAAPDSCCFIYPGGQLLQTQFWDTHPSIGPNDSWTLHGLWPDLCDGSYPTYCNSAPQYHNITSIISTTAPSLLTTMQTYWLPNTGTTEHFWQHEWNKHGTCINTLSSTCYPSSSYTPGIEVLDFFNRTVSLFQELDTFKALETAGIVPSKWKTYGLGAIEKALQEVTGREVVVGCRGNMLNQAWYSFNVRGSLQGGEFVPVDLVGKGLRCPLRGIRYLPK